MLSKAEMEAAWQTGPVGFLVNHTKKTKDKRQYKVSFIPFQTVEFAEHTVSKTVWSKTGPKAEAEVRQELSDKIYALKASGVISEVRYKIKTELVK